MNNKIPLIGINTNYETVGGGFLTMINPAYWDAILHAGGLPVLMPPLADPAQIEAFLDRVDAFLMIGGDDISAERLGVPAPPTAVTLDPRRERSDFLLLERLLARRMPTLSICLGCQQLNVIHGGTIYQDLPYDGPPVLIRHYTRTGGPLVTHGLRIESGSTLWRIQDEATQGVVNSSHHQAIRQVGAGLRAVAWAPDGITEAIEVVGQPFMLGVQWHPEQMKDDPRQRKLFAALVQYAVK